MIFPAIVRTCAGKRCFAKATLGSSTGGWGSERYNQEDWAASPDVDEREGAENGSDTELEPSLSSTSTGAFGTPDDLEDEHDGSEPDNDGEPLLGALEGIINQDDAWVSSGNSLVDHEAEADVFDVGEYDEAEEAASATKMA